MSDPLFPPLLDKLQQELARAIDRRNRGATRLARDRFGESWSSDSDITGYSQDELENQVCLLSEALGLLCQGAAKASRAGVAL